MSLVFEALHGETTDISEVIDIDDSNVLSTNLERMRNEIKDLVNNDKEKAIYSNVVRYLIEYDKDNESSEHEEVPDVTIDELRSKERNLSQLMEKELIEYMKKEVKSLKLCEINSFEVLNVNDSKTDYDIDIMQLKEKTGYVIDRINLNTIKFNVFIDQLCSLFEHVWIVKCGVDDRYSERIVLVLDGRNSNNSIPKRPIVPINQEELINFLYAMYSMAIFALRSDEFEFQKIVECSTKLLNSVKLF